MNDIGVVMPVYNQVPSYLITAIQSILNQSYSHFQLVIVIDGASTETVTIVEQETKEDKRVKIIYKEKNEGVSKALNTGFDYLMNFSDIKYFTWVSSDNIYYDVFLEELRKVLHEGPPNLGLVYSSFRHVDEDGMLTKGHPIFEDFHKFQDQPKEKLLDVCLIGVSFMYKKYFAQQLDGYVMEPIEDYEYWLRLTEICEVKYIPLELMDYRVDSPKSISSQLKSSIKQHRRWRYAFNLARQQARNRRNIPFELTILFPVKEGSAETIKKLEELYDQSFSNFKVLVLDISPNSIAIPKLNQISDPRCAFLKLPNMEEIEAIKLGVKAADTTYTILLGKGVFPSSVSVLYNLITFHQQLEDRFPGHSAFDNDGGAVSYRKDCSLDEPTFGQVYKTVTLLKALNNH
ncbi:glycosyltransferase family 2 protein [Peribacillus phoenicis]|uniref:glycosyltransferase family 2 protein n=1 Tax=unclassified Peribacillus TaxID=2675266 RepID=UPI0039A18855